MAQNDFADGWGVVDQNGLNVRTVSDSRRAAILNWLVVEKQLVATRSATDERIERMWDANCGDAIAVKVRIYVQ